MRAAFQKLARDRFFLFLLIGAGLFGLDAALPERDAREVVIGPGELAMLQARRQAQWGAEAEAPHELRALLDAHLREEILVREALRLGLDRGDVIVRRRLAQKMEFLLRGEVGEPAVDEAQAAAWYALRRTDYAEPKRVAFRHIFLGDGPQAEAEAAALAARLPALLRRDANAWRGIGKPFASAREHEARSLAEVRGRFGAAFAERLLQEEQVGAWWGPLRSAYGVHLVQTTRVLPARERPFAEVRERVLEELRRIRREEGEARAFDRLRSRYRVRYTGAALAAADAAADGRRAADGEVLRESKNTGRELESSDAVTDRRESKNAGRELESAADGVREPENAGRELESSDAVTGRRESKNAGRELESAADGVRESKNTGRELESSDAVTGRREPENDRRELESSDAVTDRREPENTGRELESGDAVTGRREPENTGRELESSDAVTGRRESENAGRELKSGDAVTGRREPENAGRKLESSDAVTGRRESENTGRKLESSDAVTGRRELENTGRE